MYLLLKIATFQCHVSFFGVVKKMTFYQKTRCSQHLYRLFNAVLKLGSISNTDLQQTATVRRDMQSHPTYEIVMKPLESTCHSSFP